ncbi:50S ribosomal protein L19 [Candidatus Collierbacteria bacterium]|nr:50S ribosomal protein L19 [Candidatus Collierbacteria bacterium]
MSLQTTVCNTIVSIGDNVTVGQKIKEGEKDRVQNFSGIVIAIKGNQGEKTFTVRRIAAGAIGVEKIFPVDMPSLVSVKIVRQAAVRRSKLYFLRERIGKGAGQLPERKAKQKPALKTKQPPEEKKAKTVKKVDENKQKPVKSSGKPRGRGRQKVSSKK